MNIFNCSPILALLLNFIHFSFNSLNFAIDEPDNFIKLIGELVLQLLLNLINFFHYFYDVCFTSCDILNCLISNSFSVLHDNFSNFKNKFTAESQALFLYLFSYLCYFFDFWQLGMFICF